MDYVSKEQLEEFFKGITITSTGRTRGEAIRAVYISEVLKAVYNGVMKLITTDAVPVVRCKDCKHRPIGGEAYNHTLIFPDEYCPCNCVDDNWYSWMPDNNWFCGNGERKVE